MQNKSAVAEVEVKFQVMSAEYIHLLVKIRQLRFRQAPDEYLTDYYLDFARSAVAGYDFTRLRWPEDGAILLTHKKWVKDDDGNPVRIEDESTIEKADAQRLLKKNPRVRKLEKKRLTFHGTIPPHVATIVLDQLSLRYDNYCFIECEVLTTLEKAENIRQQLFDWVIINLPIAARQEAPSMLEIILQDEG